MFPSDFCPHRSTNRKKQTGSTERFNKHYCITHGDRVPSGRILNTFFTYDSSFRGFSHPVGQHHSGHTENCRNTQTANKQIKHNKQTNVHRQHFGWMWTGICQGWTICLSLPWFFFCFSLLHVLISCSIFPMWNGYFCCYGIIFLLKHFRIYCLFIVFLLICSNK